MQIRFQKKITDWKIFIPAIFFLSPYYRAGSIWLDDNIVALIFFILSIFFFLKFQHQKKKIIYIILTQQDFRPPAMFAARSLLGLNKKPRT